MEPGGFEVADGWVRTNLESVTNGDTFTDVFMDSSVKNEKHKPFLVETHIRKDDGRMRHFFFNGMLKVGDCCLFFKDEKLSSQAVAIYSCFGTRLDQIRDSKMIEISTEPPPNSYKLTEIKIPLWIKSDNGEDLVSNSTCAGAQLKEALVTIDTTRVFFDSYTTRFFQGSMMGIIRDEKVPQLIRGIVCEGDDVTDPEKLERMKNIIHEFNNKVSP